MHHASAFYIYISISYLYYYYYTKRKKSFVFNAPIMFPRLGTMRNKAQNNASHDANAFGNASKNIMLRA